MSLTKIYKCDHPGCEEELTVCGFDIRESQWKIIPNLGGVSTLCPKHAIQKDFLQLPIDFNNLIFPSDFPDF